MPSDRELPVGYRFDPTKEELLSYLQPETEDLNGRKLADIPRIEMEKHDPSDFAESGALMGKDCMYIFAMWERKYSNGKRRNRQVEQGSKRGHWKLQGSEPIRSSDGDKQIGTKKNYDFKVDNKVQWHMEEYLLYPEESSKVSICRVSKKCSQARCRVSKKCSQARRTTKIDAKGDIRFGEPRCSTAAETQDQTLLFSRNPILESFEYGCPLPNNSKGKREADPSCISDTGNGPEDVSYLCPQANNSKGKKEAGPPCISHMDSGREMNEGQKDSDAPFWRNLYSGLHGPRETGYSYRDNLVGNPDIGNYQSANDKVPEMNDGTEMEDCFSSDPDHSYPIRPNAFEEYVGNHDTGNYQSANEAVPDMNNGTDIVNCFSSDLDHSYPIWSNAPKEYGHNPWTPSCPNANDTVWYMNDVMVNYLLSHPDQMSNAAEEYGHNPWTPSCPNANDTVRNMNDVMVDYPLSDPDQTNPIRSNVGEEYLENLGTGYYQGADDTVPIDMDDAIRTGNCLLSPDDLLKDYYHKVQHLVPTTECPRQSANRDG